jgi:hypothetical protein
MVESPLKILYRYPLPDVIHNVECDKRLVDILHTKLVLWIIVLAVTSVSMMIVIQKAMGRNVLMKNCEML